MSSMRKLTCCCLLLAVLIPISAAARDWYVTVDGSGDVPTIQAAIDSAAWGDTVTVAAGRYTWSNQGSGNSYGLIQFMRGTTGFLFRSESGPIETILDAQQQGRVAFIQGENVLTIDGFTFTGGVAPAAGNEAGGGIAGHLSSPIIKNSVFKLNSAAQGGGLWYGGVSAPRIENCDFVANQATYGGAVFLINSSTNFDFSECIFRANSASLHGGAIFVYHAPLVLESSAIYNNSADQNGGGIYFDYAHASRIRGCTLAENTAAGGSGMYFFRDVGAITIEQTIISYGNGGAGLTIGGTAFVSVGCSNLYGNGGGDAFPPGTIDLGGNFTLDPEFCGPLRSRNYTLNTASPCAPGNHPSGEPCGLIGYYPTQCGDIPVDKRTWGSIKNLYSD